MTDETIHDLEQQSKEKNKNIFLSYNYFNKLIRLNLINHFQSEGINSIQHNEESVDELTIGDKKMVQHYHLSPYIYFQYFDRPLLEIIFLIMKFKPGTRKLSVWKMLEDKKSIYQVVCKYAAESNIIKEQFGIKITPQKADTTVEIPLFCDKARIEAFERFVVYRMGMKSLSTHSYQTCKLPYPTLVKSLEDRWFYEMCSGVSFVTDILACLLEIDHTKSVKGKINDSLWETYRVEIFAELLSEYRALAECPALFWRSAAIRHIFFKVDKKCREYELGDVNIELYTSRWKDLNSLAPDSKLNKVAEVKEWYIFAKYWFMRFFADEISYFGICTREYTQLLAFEFLQPKNSIIVKLPDISNKFLPKSFDINACLKHIDACLMQNDTLMASEAREQDEFFKRSKDFLDGLTIDGTPFDFSVDAIPYQFFCNIRKNLDRAEYADERLLYQQPLASQEKPRNKIQKYFLRIHQALYPKGYLNFQIPKF